MATTTVSPAQSAKTLKIQKTVFDLTSFDDVTLVKEVAFSPVSSIDEASNLLGNDSAKLLAIINEGLASEIRRTNAGDPTGWQSTDEDGNVVGNFTGTIADSKAVNNLVLTLAKTVFGYNKDMSADEKRSAKENAINMVKSNDAIRRGLQSSAAQKSEE